VIWGCGVEQLPGEDACLELGERPVPDEDARTRHYQEKVRAAGAAPHRGEEDPKTLMFFTLGLVGWSLTMPQLHRMILGPGYSLEQLRPAISDAVRTLTTRPADPT